MKHILLILTGGTICTRVTEDGTRAVSAKAAAQLKLNFLNNCAYAEEIQIEESENFYVLSENMTIDIWNRLIDYLRTVDFSAYDGIVIAHGTDTLAYSAAMFSYVLTDAKIPVFFVSSQRPLSDPLANGNANFKAAVDCIMAGITPNVYVTYLNISDGKMYLHLGSHIRQCENYSDDFESFDAIDISMLSDASLEKIKKAYPSKEKHPICTLYGDWHLKDTVLMIAPYVGLNYDAFSLGSYRAVLHGTYHSGTVCTQTEEHHDKYSILYLLDRCKENHVALYLSPSKVEGEVYDTVPTVARHHNAPHFLWGMTTEASYAKLVLLYSLYDREEEIDAWMKTDVNFEMNPMG